MADYPAFPILRDSSAKPRDGLQIDRAVNGSARGRQLWTSAKVSLVLKHVLTDAERAALDAFYLANRGLEVSVDNLLATGTFMIVAPPQYRQITVSMWEASVTLEEV